MLLIIVFILQPAFVDDPVNAILLPDIKTLNAKSAVVPKSVVVVSA